MNRSLMINNVRCNLNTIVFLLVLLTYGCSIHAQIPIGEEMDEGISHLTTYLEDCGFSFYNQSVEYDRKYNPTTGQHDIFVNEHITIRFREEFKAKIYFNEYGNITSVWFSSVRHETLQELLTCLKYKSWILVDQREDMFGVDYIYKIEDKYYGLLPPPGDINQVNFFNYKPQ